MHDAPARDVTLAFDTSGPACCAAVLAGNDIVAARIEPMARGQAERLIPLLEDLLHAAGLVWADVTRIGVGIGPGNFTGIRISVAAARGLALSLGCPAIGVSILDALAHGQPRPCLTVVAARRGMIHVQTHDDGPFAAPQTLPVDDPAMWTVVRGIPVCGDDAERIAELTAGPVLAETGPRAVAIARIAGARALAGHGMDRPRPLYLRSADAAPTSDQPPRMLAP